jgi:hypothetical protein
MKSKPSSCSNASHHESGPSRDSGYSGHGCDPHGNSPFDTHTSYAHDRDGHNVWNRHGRDGHWGDGWDFDRWSSAWNPFDGRDDAPQGHCHAAAPDPRCNGSGIDVDLDQHGKFTTVDIDVKTDLGSVDLDLKLNTSLLQPDHTPMTVMVGGEGNAVGDDTLVDADIVSRLIDYGKFSIAYGSAVVHSAAESAGDLAFAGADTFVDVSGADFVFSFTEKRSVTGSTHDSQFAMETSKVAFVAIDFDDFDLPGGQLTVSADEAQSIDLGCFRWCLAMFHDQLDGNVAQLNVDAAAYGTSTLVDVESSVLTVEDQLSSVSAMAISVIG